MRSIRNGAVALALVGGLAACTDDPTAPEAAAENEQATTAAPAPECPAVAVGRDTLTPGCWAIQARGLPDSPLAGLDLPEGFSGNDAWVWVNDVPQDEWGAITLLPVGGVYADPCTRAGNPPKADPSVEEFAEALAVQEVTTTTEPVPVSLDGHEGVYFEVSVPAGFDANGCRGKELVLWETGGTEYASPGVSDTSRYWVLDVDGQGVVLVVNTHTRATDRTVARFTRIAESATFAPG
jgi:hypothetical protein